MVQSISRLRVHLFIFYKLRKKYTIAGWIN